MAKTAIVTGANTGIGKEIARGLTAAGYHVILACRDVAKGQEAAKEIGGSTEVRSLDVASETSIKAFVDGFSQRGSAAMRGGSGASEDGRTPVRTPDGPPSLIDKPIDVLVNNAGARVQARRENADGVELTWATNVAGPLHLTQLLLPRLKEAPAARIVNIASTFAKNLDLDDVQVKKGTYDGGNVYMASKQANRMLTWALAAKLAGTKVTANAMCPQFVKTGLNREVTGMTKLFFSMMSFMQRTPAKGAETAIWMATAPELEGVSNKFFVDKKERECKFRADQAKIDRLWQLTALSS